MDRREFVKLLGLAPLGFIVMSQAEKLAFAQQQCCGPDGGKPEPGWPPEGRIGAFSWIAKMAEAHKLLEPIELQNDPHVVTIGVSYKTIYGKERVHRRHGRRIHYRPRHTIKTSYKDFAWKEAALAAVDQEGNIVVVKIKKTINDLKVLTEGYEVSLQYRPSGIKWNGKNTAFNVTGPGQRPYTVIGLKWLEMEDATDAKIDRHGRRHSVVTHRANPVIHIPYSTGLDQEELVRAGYFHLQNETIRAFNDLAKKKVPSLAFPGEIVTERRHYQEPQRLALMEQTDPTEFAAYVEGSWPYSPFARVLVRLGANDECECEFNQLHNYAGARGLMQWTNGHNGHGGTWDVVRHDYPAARLPDYQAGASVHRWGIEAAVLLYDYNLSLLIKRFGPEIANDPELEYYLGAAYNGGVGHVFAGISCIRRPGHEEDDWTDKLPKETRIYVEELRYLKAHPIKPF